MASALMASALMASALMALPWFTTGVRDLHAFRIEQGSDFTKLHEVLNQVATSPPAETPGKTT